jgi:DNA-binding IscR family transcriptional regulator
VRGRSPLDGRILAALAAGPLPGATLAAAVGVPHHQLRRVLAGMKKRGLVDLNRSGYFLVRHARGS